MAEQENSQNSFNEIKFSTRKRWGPHAPQKMEKLHFFQKKLTFPTIHVQSRVLAIPTPFAHLCILPKAYMWEGVVLEGGGSIKSQSHPLHRYV